MSKGGKLKCNIFFGLYFTSSRNVCNPRPLDVPSTRKHVHFAREWAQASSYGSKLLTLNTPPFPEQMLL